MSVGLSESQHYIWNTQRDADCLGEGSFGKVYRGTHKKTGDKVAVKTFKHVTEQVSQETRMLQTLKHQYIIQLLAIEMDTISKNMVMIMELCNGGSLMRFLNEPENVCGLLDGEFLLVFEHLSGGLEYLKRHNVIHRDVKPDNLMRHVLDDGRIIYKLADFGTARELPEGQNFYSLHGTEPYLNPQMFKVCFFRNAEFKREFGANTDLWSIGVTLYQTATGNLAFLAPDRHVRLTIYNEMKHRQGIISAVQQPNSEEVVYQTKLPKTCRLSLGLKELITPIIAGLFIQDKARQWSFIQYYEQVLELVSRKVINVFFVNKMQMLKVYIKPDETFNDFKYYVRQQTKVDDENQVFLYRQNLIVNNFDDFGHVDSECVFLFDRSNTDVVPTGKTLISETLFNFPKTFLSNPDFEDSKMVYMACRDLCVCKNLMEYQSNVYSFFSKFIRDFNAYCKKELEEIDKVYNLLLEKYSSANNRIKILEKLEKLNQSNDLAFITEFETVTYNFVQRTSKLFNSLLSAKTEMNLNTSHDSYLSIVIKELADMNDLMKNLYNARGNKRLYQFEKVRIVHCVRTILEIFTDKMDPNFDVFVIDMKRWYQNEFFPYVRSLYTLKKHLHRYRCDFKIFEEKINTRSEKNLSTITTTKEISSEKQKLIEILTKYEGINADMQSIIEENVILIEQMNDLILNMNSDVDSNLFQLPNFSFSDDE